jgi:uncharacterized membrane protein required for colicin V production
MNLINAIFILLILIAILEGIYRGFLHTAFDFGGFLLAIITSYLLYPIVSAAVKASKPLFNFLLYYTEGAEKIVNFQDTSLLVSNIGASQLDSIIASSVSQSSLTEPFATLIHQNVLAQAFAADGLKTLGEYYNMTIVCTVLNILSFVIVFLLARMVYIFVLGAINYTVRFPELKQYDRGAGVLFGAGKGVLLCFLIVIVIPVIFLIVPVDRIAEYFNESSMGMFFYQNNFFLHLIRGTV